MEDPVQTPRPPAAVFQFGRQTSSKEQPLLSSSPGFGTPAYPIQPRRSEPRPAFEPQLRPNGAQTILPILLPPQTLRPVAFRTLTKKHNLTITSSGLGALASFIGKFCGAEWRQTGSAERVLDEIAKQWKRDGGGLILDDGQDKKLKTILKCLEPCMSGGKLDSGRLTRSNSGVGSLSRQNSDLARPDISREDSLNSLGVSRLDVEDSEMDQDQDVKQDARLYLKVVSAYEQPRMVYSITKKTLEPDTSRPSLLPPIQQKILSFKDRYNLVHQRLMRNEAFQTTSFSSTTGLSLARSASTLTAQQAYKITSISNLLGRTGSSHLLLGLLVHNASGDLSLSDLTGSVVLDIASGPARPVPDEQAWFCPGMIVLVEGVYEEDGSNTSTFGSAGGVGGQIKGRFIADTLAGPPAERREITLGTGHNHRADSTHSVAGAGYGWFDFLGTGSEKALGQQMRRIQRKVLGAPQTMESLHIPEEETSRRTKTAILGECNLDKPQTLASIRSILRTYSDAADIPLSIILMGNFVSAASLAGSIKGGNSIDYKEHFDSLAAVLSEFPTLLSQTTLVLVPGDNDPWPSSFSTGAATPLPRTAVPDLFTNRIRRAVRDANSSEAAKRDTPDGGSGEAVFTTNPARISLFGPVNEMVLFRDDISARLRRNAIAFPSAAAEDTEMSDGGPDAQQQSSLSKHQRLVKLLLDQSHLAPFSHGIRPVLHSFAGSLHLHPLPTSLVLCDPTMEAFAVTYEGCHFVNAGPLVGGRSREARWVEMDLREGRGIVRAKNV